MEKIGKNIRIRREIKGLTLSDLSGIVDVSAGFLSQLENGSAQPSMFTLKKIAEALNTTIGVLIGEVEDIEKNYVVRRKSKKKYKQLGNGIKMFFLTSPDQDKIISPALVHMEKSASSGKSHYQHDGQELIYILKGKIEFSVEDHSYILRKGDCIYFDSIKPHSFKNIHTSESEGLWITTPPNL